MIEILHERDPDYECNITVWIDGVEVEADIVDVDPGRGYEREEWAESAEYHANVPTRSAAFKDAIAGAYDLASESKYITD